MKEFKSCFHIFFFVSVLVLAAVCVHQPVRRYDPDELEHLRVARAVDLGRVVYRDMFEHHMPLQYAFLAPLHRLMGDTTGYLMSGRVVMMFLAAVTLVLVYAVARRYGPPESALAAAALTGLSYVFREKAFEVRPDNFMVPAVLGAALCLASAVRGRLSGAFFAGFFTALAVTASVKGGVCAAALLPVVLVRPRRTTAVPPPHRPMKTLLVWSGSAVLWLGLAAAVTRRLGMLPGLIRFNFIENAHWRYHFPLSRHLKEILFHDPALSALAAAAWLSVPFSFRVRSVPPPWWVAAVLAVLSAVLVPNPYLQNFLPLLPFLFITAAVFMPFPPGNDGGRSGEDGVRPGRRVFFFLWSGLTAGVSVFFLIGARPAQWEAYGTLRLLHVVTIILVSAAVVLRRMQRRRGAAWAAVALILLWPVAGTAVLPRPGNQRQLEAIRRVRAMTPKDGTVLDGWTGKGVLCNPAGFYPFIHIGLMRQFGDDIRRDVRRVLTSESPPAVILLDAYTLEHDFGLLDLVQEKYDWDDAAGWWRYRPGGTDRHRPPAPRPRPRDGFELVIRREE